MGIPEVAEKADSLLLRCCCGVVDGGGGRCGRTYRRIDFLIVITKTRIKEKRMNWTKTTENNTPPPPGNLGFFSMIQGWL